MKRKIMQFLFQGAIFDMDGTLIDSLWAWKDVGYNYLKSKGIVTTENINEAIRGMGFHDTAKYFISQFSIEETPEAMLDAWIEAVNLDYNQNVTLKEGIKQYLDALKAQSVKCCVATANTQDLTARVLKRLGILDYFEFIITSDEVGTSKRKPDIFLTAAQRLGFAPCDCVVFEDTSFALIAAKEAGFLTVGVRDDAFNQDTALLKEASDAYIQSFSDLL